MISERPAFFRGENFRVNPIKRRYTTLRTTKILLDVPSDETVSFRDRHGIEWVRFSPTTNGKTLMTVREGYSWDGATWAPDFCLQLETLVHDCFYQFHHTQHFTLSRRECDDAFLDLMKLSKFPLKYIYWQGVRKFGWKFRSKNGEYSKVLTTHAIP